MLIRSTRVVPLALALAVVSCLDAGMPAPVPHGPLFAITDLPSVRISEIHYDNTGTDAGEAIEVSAPVGTGFAGWSIVLYNGSGGAVYDTDALPVTAPAVCPGGLRHVIVLNYPSNGIQNGSPDGIALVGPTGVAEFLSYEGTFAAAGGAANGMLSTDIGVIENGSEPLGQSLKRDGFGAWSSPSASSFGACNDEDPPPPGEVTDVVVSPASAGVEAGNTQAFTAAAFDAGSNPVAGVSFTWSSDDEAIATVDANGLATGVSEGDVGIIVAAPNGVADTAELHVGPAPPPPPVSIVEIHYDNSGADVGEAVEVAGPAGTSLAGWSLVLYNGNGGVTYGTVPLTGTLTDQCAGNGVAFALTPGLQNGSPDGLALVAPGNVVVEFLSYEGTFAATNGPAGGMVSVDIGVDEEGESGTRSLQKDAGGWYGPVTSSFGACNVKPPPPATTIFGRSPTDDVPLPVGYQAQLFATVNDVNGNPVDTPVSWSTDTPAIAGVDQDGVITALAAGTAIIRATGGNGTTGTISLPTRVPVASTTALYEGNAEFGEPADADPSDDFILRHEQYTASFSHTRGTPNWVSYELEATHFGPEDRCNCFTFDAALPAGFQRYTTADYTGAGAFHGYGIDRGHLARSFDRTSGSLDNARTFLFTNIVPQAADKNQGPWSDFEFHLGDLARFENKEVYIVTGVAGSKGTVKNEGLITIPAHTWKVAVILPRDQGLADVHGYHDIEVISVVMPNDPGGRNDDWTVYRTSVDAVEALSGYDVLALLPNEIEVAVETGLGDLIDQVTQLAANGTVSAGNANSLTQKLQAAVNQLAQGGSAPAASQLTAFLRELSALVRSGRLGEDDAAPLQAAVAGIIQSIEVAP